MVLLYPTETLYALGVNAIDPAALRTLFALKGRDESKAASWLVPSIAQISEYAAVDEIATRIAARFLPGPVTLVLPALPHVSDDVTSPDRTIGFRVSSDPMAQTIIDAFYAQHGAPLTCTSANRSGQPTLNTVAEILQQFGPQADQITEIHDDGPRKGLASTVVRVVGEQYEVLREGAVSEADIKDAVRP
jgi:tRNA threonylcarbamoyl adenosine modification protein (Sua5/YciO/YrdC/YwlC family)